MTPPPLTVILSGILLAFINGCTPQRPQTSPNPLPQTLAQNITTIITAPPLKQAIVGISIIRLKDQQPLFSHNENKLLHPASTTKLFTSALALEYLGAQYIYSTDIAIPSPPTIAATTTIDTIYLIGSGDPSLTTEDIQNLAEQLHDQGIRRIDRIIADASIFDTIPYGQGWMWDDRFYKDFAPISGLSVNRNCIEIRVRPSRKIGQPLHITTEPETSFITIFNQGNTAAAGLPLKVQRNEHQPNQLTLSGSLARRDQERHLTRAIDNPPLYAGTLLMETCQRLGIQVTHRPETGTTPQGATIIARHQSSALREIIRAMNKDSINLYAEQILKTVAHEETGETGSSKQAIQLLKELLQTWKIPEKNFIFADGSGVSRYNLVTPKTLTDLLVHLYRDQQKKAPLINSLAIGGHDGDLNWRMQNLAKKRNIHAKTGYLRGVSTLAGYIDTESGETLAFAIMVQHFKESATDILEIQDRICEILSQL